MSFSIDRIPLEVWRYIFQYLDFESLENMRNTHPLFQDIIDNLLFSSEPRVVTNHNEYTINRTYKKLPLGNFDKHHLQYNWVNGIFNEHALLRQNKKFMPHLHLDSENVWISHGNNIKMYKRRENLIDTTPHLRFNTQCRNDICDFVVNDLYIVTGHMGGELALWSRMENTGVFHCDKAHMSDVDSVDISEDVLASGSRDATVKVWSPIISRECKGASIYTGDRVLCVEFNADKCLAFGTAGKQADPLGICDVETLKIKRWLKERGSDLGSGILNIKWETPNILWSCGYDSTVRKWDLRSNECVFKVEDHASIIYCFETDFSNTLVTGSERYGRVVLWDVRKTDFVQIYFLESCRSSRTSSPIYSLSYDPRYLLAATERHLNILDFKTFNKVGKNYKQMYDKIDHQIIR